MHRFAVVLLLLCFVCFVKGEINCRPNEYDSDDSYLISAILEHALSNDCTTLRKLSGIFFENQERLPHSVRITYTLCIPYNSKCEQCQYNCWLDNDMCREGNSEQGNSTTTGICPEDTCYVKKEFIWGRIPLIVHDNIYRTLNICPFMIGGNTERTIKINFTFISDIISDGGNCIPKEIPCNWCMGNAYRYKWKYYSGIDKIDDVATIDQYYSSLDRALITVTEKLQGYAVKAQKLPWLTYSSDLASGYAAPYPVITVSWETALRYIGFCISYVLFQLILFMLIYKYRRRLYRRIYIYINTDPINSAFFYSFIVTTILTSLGMLEATNYGGYCLSMLQMIFLGIALMFGIPHCLITCFRLKKTPNFFITYPFFCCCLRFKWLNVFLQVLVFWLLYSMPHVIVYLLLIFSLDFLYNPFNYLIVLMFLAFSILILWVGNAIAIHLMSPSLIHTRDIIKNKVERRRLIFGICIATAVNTLYFAAWGFIATFYYDKRGQSTSYLTFIPGFSITILGWYLSGDMVKLFDMFTRSSSKEKEAPRKESKGSIKEISINDDDDDDDEEEESAITDHEESLEALNIIQKQGDKARYSVKRIRRIIRAVQPAFGYNETTDEGTSLIV